MTGGETGLDGLHGGEVIVLVNVTEHEFPDAGARSADLRDSMFEQSDQVLAVSVAIDK